ncbi:glycosyltransferase family 2 protein [uncultured Draconibacterium sp.]|uniref:glycosyltransferase family 2 protein n=1 Tax=uncultured Draconibacterium sp. TaxID=1573823 RepID=UPI0032613E23
MANISVIILTYNEEKHIERCIENVKPFGQDIIIVDSYSTDKTIEIAKTMGAKVYLHKWPGNQAKQFNWALENLSINSEWILRLDADEYLLPELVKEIKVKLENIQSNVNGIVFKRRHIFLGKWMKRGTYPVKLLRLFRQDKAVCEQRWMDEHIQLVEGKMIEFEHDFVDHNLNNLSWFLQKHIGYSIREAIDLLDIELNLFGKTDCEAKLSEQAAAKRRKKLKYAKQPLFWRSFAYFVYRYFFTLGFLEGKEGFLWHFLQGWWYRTLVDAKVWEIKKACGTDKEKIREYVKNKYELAL